MKLRRQILAMRNKSDDSEQKCQYGVRFMNPESNDRLILGSLVCYQMLEYPRSVIWQGDAKPFAAPCCSESRTNLRHRRVPTR
jgi:hypothetical protein